MASFLLVDFGTTSIKTAIADLDTGTFSQIQSHSSVASSAQELGHYEVSPCSLRERFLSICDLYFNRLGVRFEGIALCSEQNGFVALSSDNLPITNYISWKDERSLEPSDGVTTYSLLTDELGERFKDITGWRPGPGLPFMNVTHLARQSLLKGSCRIVSLPEWLSLCSDDSTGTVHDTMLHGLGFYDVRRKKISDELTNLVEGMTGVKCTFNHVAPTGSVSGYWHSDAERIPIYVGIGDHQCSVLGACNVPSESISVNIGTGSQVAVIDPEEIPEEVELRPYFDDRLLVAVTRIPGGRALAGYIVFLEDVCKRATGKDTDFWGMLGEVDQDSVANATLDFDLGIFASAWNYKGGGSISGIVEGSLTLRNYLSSLLKALVQQYLEVAKRFDPLHRMRRCILSGGVPRRMPVLHSIISSLSGYETLPACEIDESLIGLRTVALVASSPEQSCLDAQEVYGRSCSVQQNG